MIFKRGVAEYILSHLVNIVLYFYLVIAYANLERPKAVLDLCLFTVLFCHISTPLLMLLLNK